MAIEITTRHMKVSAEVKDHAQSRGDQIADEFSNVENVHVIIDGRSHRKMAEIVVQGKNHLRIEASGLADEIIPAIDMAVDKAVGQLRKASKKIQEHRE